ncbi:hypothetical protein Tco_0085349 [Tanacetum coccineum]
MGTCPFSLLANKAALMLSVEAARYIIRTSPCIGAVSVGKVSTNFFVSWSAAAASCVHCIQEALLAESREGLYLPIDLGQRVTVFGAGFVYIREVNTHSSSSVTFLYHDWVGYSCLMRGLP